MAQLQKFQALVAGPNSRHSTKVGACLMVCVATIYLYTSTMCIFLFCTSYFVSQVIVLCFAVFLGGWAPQKHAYWTSLSSDYTTSGGCKTIIVMMYMYIHSCSRMYDVHTLL